MEIPRWPDGRPVCCSRDPQGARSPWISERAQNLYDFSSRLYKKSYELAKEVNFKGKHEDAKWVQLYDLATELGLIASYWALDDFKP